MSLAFKRCKRKAIRIVNSLFPKNKHKVIFASMPDFADNARALYDYMVSQSSFDDWQFVWVVNPKFMIPKQRRTLFIHHSETFFSFCYLRYLYHLFTSKYLFCTHSHFVEANPKYQVSVCLWHGTMLKRICAMNEREKNQPRKNQYRYFISPSTFYNDYFCKSFLCKPEQVLTCGYPRNDFLFQETNILEKLEINRNLYGKIIVYMPTFRTPIGGGYADSSANIQSCINLSDRKRISELSKELQGMNVLLIIKWHPADTRQNSIIDTPNIISVSNRKLEVLDLQVYHLLHYADALITDYSSVYCDYLVLDRPIAFDIADIDSYSDNRGFVFENPLDYMPGMKMRDENDFLLFCKNISINVDEFKIERESLSHIYNDYLVVGASERLVNRLILKDNYC